MKHRLEDELIAMRGEPPAPRYGRIEAQVWASIDSVRQHRMAARELVGVRIAALAVALGVGMVGGGAAALAVADERQEVSVFSVNAELAPSTLLDRHG